LREIREKIVNDNIFVNWTNFLVIFACFIHHKKWTSLLCKVEFTLLQSIFSRQIFLLYFGKGKFGGKKFTLQKSEFYFAKEFFPQEIDASQILSVL
jgi:hypothetical protein